MIFDFHPHTSLKPFLSRLDPDKKISCWEKIEVCLVIDDLTGDRVDSQSCLSQMHDGKVTLAVATLYALEREIASTFLIKLVNFFSLKLSNRLLHRINVRKPGYGYIDLIKGELQHYRKAVNEKPGQLVFLKKGDSLDPANLDGKINVIFAIEGGHAMLDTESVEDFDYNDDVQINTVLSRLESFLGENPDLIFSHLTIAHIARSIFCNQAFAYPNFNEKCSTEDFLPRSIIGINKAGLRLIEKCREKNILIDIKHMSYASRCQYYKYLADNGATTPIIASHMGIAGIAFKEVKKLWTILSEFKSCYKIQVHRPQGLLGTKFSPLTLNLFDEEIKFIVDSGGLIGLSMDERILGYVKNDDIFDIEYIYTEEYNNLLTGSYNIDYGFLGAAADGSTYLTASAAYPHADDIRDIHTLYFCNNVLRIVYAGGANAWNCICIGSDYDGLIDAVQSCKTADQFENFRLKILYWLPIMIKTVDNYGAIFYVDESDLENDIKQKVDKIMFENGRKFFTNLLAP